MIGMPKQIQTSLYSPSVNHRSTSEVHFFFARMSFFWDRMKDAGD